jgi:hypothetical protein
VLLSFSAGFTTGRTTISLDRSAARRTILHVLNRYPVILGFCLGVEVRLNFSRLIKPYEMCCTIHYWNLPMCGYMKKEIALRVTNAVRDIVTE